MRACGRKLRPGPGTRYTFNMSTPLDSERLLRLAREVLLTEAAGIRALVERLDGSFLAAVQLVLQCPGRVVVSGMGKSGHISRKIASTLASTGTPAFFVHPAEASHGDLGMITAQDVFIALSNSGEVAEILEIVPHVRRQGARIIALTGRPESSLAQAADVHLNTAVDAEACPLGLAPTASTTAALAMGDALALALLDARGFSAEDFARSHPGGALGRRLLTHVRDVMRSGVALPVVSFEASLADAIMEITGKGMGMTAVLDARGQVAGIFTDGDLRRCLGKVSDFAGSKVSDYMTHRPRTIGPDQLAVDAVSLMENHRVTQLLVIDSERRLVGALNTHDLLRAKVV